MNVKDHFRGKKITVMGLGLLGRGVGDARFLAECGAELIVTDLKTSDELQDSIAQLAAFPDITFVLGEHRKEDFRDRDFIVKAAGVPLDSPYIAEAKKNGIPVRMSADLFAELSGIPVAGVTGTRGKSTVAHLVHAIVEASGRPVVLGGNVRGVSTLALLSEVTPKHVAVLELDSWQLQGWGEARMSPHIAVFTTLYPDHLNYYSRASERIAKMNLGNSERAMDESFAYKDDPDAYLGDKANIFLHQDEDDVLILGAQCAPTVIDRYGERIQAKTLVVDELKLPDTWVLKIPGLHNRYDAALALAAARSLGIEDEVSRQALTNFSGVPGRLELIREADGIQFYNDTTSTTPEATLAALSALEPSRTILIMGGSDKGLDMESLLEKLPEVKKVILLAGTGTDRIKDSLAGNTIIYDTISRAVKDAIEAAEPGDAIVLSPAFASFGMFKNEFDRGDQFNAIVEKL